MDTRLHGAGLVCMQRTCIEAFQKRTYRDWTVGLTSVAVRVTLFQFWRHRSVRLASSAARYYEASVGPLLLLDSLISVPHVACIQRVTEERREAERMYRSYRFISASDINFIFSYPHQNNTSVYALCENFALRSNDRRSGLVGYYRADLDWVVEHRLYV
jgi:hypothetical protein